MRLDTIIGKTVQFISVKRFCQQLSTYESRVIKTSAEP
jgi:hypothetical protein